MDSSTVMSGGRFSGLSIGTVNLDSSVPHRPQPHHRLLHVQPRPATGLDLDHRMPLFGPAAPSINPPFHGKGIYPYAAATKGNGHGQQSLAAAGADSGKEGFPWQRMKWTHDVVRQLIRIVTYVEDEGAQEAGNATKRKHGVAFQKKGKWRMVSLLMQENGAYVSPQQCEDKFNGLNKTYKRLIDILGPAASFIVVNDPASLESMPIPQQAKSGVKRILKSKHLFYKEMSAYHAGQKVPDFPDINLQSCLLPTVAPSKVGNQCVDGQEEEDGDDGDEEKGSKDIGRGVSESFLAEVDAVLRDPKRPLSERQEWLKKRELKLKEERLEINIEALAIERQLFKWQRFRCKKDREIEKSKLDAERLMLENEQMMMQMRQKELELYYKRSRYSLEEERGWELMKPGRVR